LSLNIKIGCSVCNYSDERNVNMPFNTESVVCPKCKEPDSVYIISVNETSKIKDMKISNKTLINQLIKIRKL
jgi:hypothetical protein